MKKIMFSLFLMVLLVGTVSAAEWDNKVDYEDNDMTVIITNWLGLTGWLLDDKIGEAELKSHKTVNEILMFGYGKEEVVMYYDFNFSELYENGLGDVTFTDKRTEQEIQKNYSFVYWGTETRERDIYSQDCNKNINGTTSCQKIINGTENYEFEGWLPYNSKDIPNKNIRIGLKTYVGKNDYIDGVWTIAGKKVQKHAEWTVSLNAQLITYLTLNNSVGVVFDSLGNATNVRNNGSTRGVAGKIDNAFDLESTEADYIDLGNKSLFNFSGSLPFAVSMWIKLESDCDCALFSRDVGGGTGGYNFKRRSGDNFIGIEMNNAGELTGTIPVETGTFYHIVINFDTDNESIWVNGTHDISKGSRTSLLPDPDSNGTIGQTEASGEFFDGIIDEVAIWNRSLSSAEIVDLFNDFNGITFREDIILVIDSPTNTTHGTGDIDYNITLDQALHTAFFSVDSGANNTLDNDSNTNYFNLSGNHPTLSNGFHNITFWVNDTAGNANKKTVFFTIDLTAPTLNVTLPFGVINFQDISNNQTLNWNVSDTNIDACILQYNGINTTLTCADNTTSFTIEDARTLTFFTNDTLGNMASQVVNWSYLVLQRATSFNSSSFETAIEKFTVNVTTNGSVITAGTLTFNGTKNTGATITNPSGDNYSITKTITIPTSTGTKTHNFNLTINGKIINTSTQNQITNLTYFTLCNSTYTTPFVNYTFKDETDSSTINATIPSSTFTYYLSEASVNKSFTYSSANLKYNYTFCGVPNRTLNVEYNLQYASTGYPQRIHEETKTYNQTLMEKIFYLLGTANGIYVTFQVINVAEQPIADVAANATRSISGSNELVGIGTTGADGGITFWLNPDFLHAFEFFKTGFDLFTTSIFPTQSSYTINLGGTTSSNVTDYTQGVNYTIRPLTSTILNNDTLYNFNFSLTSSFRTVTNYGFSLVNSTGTVYNTTTSTDNGGLLNVKLTLSNTTSDILMNYFWVIQGNATNGTVKWSVWNSAGTGWGVNTFFTHLKSYTDIGLFGLDDFGLALIGFIIIFTFTGVLSFKYGLVSPAAIAGVALLFTAFLDFGVGLFDGVNPEGVPYFPTIFLAIIFIGLLIKESTK